MMFRLGMTFLVVSLACLYFPLNRKLTGGFNLSTRLAAWIPLWPVWVIPYLLCLPFWVGGLIWAAWKMDEQLFRSFISACLFVLFSATLFYYFIPTYIKRPILANGNWTMRILEMVYRNDGLYNAFPSGHVISDVCNLYIPQPLISQLPMGLDRHCGHCYSFNTVHPPTSSS